MTQSNQVIRQISLALAAQHEREDYSPTDNMALTEQSQCHYAKSLQLVNQPSSGNDLEGLLVSSHLFLGLSAFQDVSVQTGDALSRLIACAKILREHRISRQLNTRLRPPSDLIESCLEPFSLCLE